MLLLGESALAWDCEECVRDGLQADRNCDGADPDFRFVGRSSGIVYDRCPKAALQQYRTEAALVLDAIRFLRFRVLPDPGGWLDQDPVWLAAFELVDDEARRIERQEAKLNGAT